MKTWIETFQEVMAVTNLKGWATVRRAGTSRSADALIRRLTARFPDYCFTRIGPAINAIKPSSESLVDMAKRRDEEGRTKYGNQWAGRSPVAEIREELADAYNYVQWAGLQEELSEDEVIYFTSRILSLDHDLRLCSETPPLKGAPQIKNRLDRHYRLTRTVQGEKKDEPSE